MQILSAAYSDIGPSKEVNQDSYYYAIRPDCMIPAGIFAVADGVSGSAHGEVASRLCAKELADWWESVFPSLDCDKSRVVPSLTEKILDINRVVCALKLPDGGRSSTTLTVLLLLGDEWFTFNAGDSRTYRLRRGLVSQLDQITEDQSCLVEREYNGEKYLKSVLTSCIGGRNEFKYGYSSGPLREGDRFFLCSDGICKTVSDRQIKKSLGAKNQTPEEICKNLVALALANGETDNVTAITVLC